MTGCNGQDWSSYQSTAPSTAGLAFFFTKVTQGTGYVNPEWQAQYAHGKSAGLLPGKYHYPDMRNPAASEADYFLAHADVQPGDMIALDWEGYDAANLTVPKATQAAFKDAWLAYVKAKLPHNPVGLYCDQDYWLHVDTTSNYGDFLWIATAGLPAGQPGIQAAWLFHQYAASPVDQDYCHLTAADLQAWAATFQEDPVSTPTPAQIATAVVAEMENQRDALAFAPVYWLRRALDPSLPLPSGADLPNVVAEVAGLRAALTAQNAALGQHFATIAGAIASLAGSGLSDAQVAAVVDQAVAEFAAALAKAAQPPAAP